MVLQNKHKARASRRYNAARGGISDSRGRGGGGGRGRGSFRGRGNEAFPSLNPDDDQEGEEQEDEQGEGSSEEDKGKYSRRKLESNAWRYQEEEIDPHAEEAEPEPEVDLSGLLERVAKLDSSRSTNALTSEKAAESSLQADLQDIDQSLIYLLDRQREREKSSSRDKVESTGTHVKAGGLSASEIKLLEMEGKKLLEERETQRRHYGRAQMLKSQNQQSRVKSIDIGDRRRVTEEKEQPKSKSKGRDREKINMAALYDDADDSKAAADDGLDAFLQELDLGKKPDAVSHSADKSKNLEAIKMASAPPSSLSQHKEHEDFLDSII